LAVGVGFSYSTDTSDYVMGDKQTAEDNYALIQAFLTRFPHLRTNDFYLTSESYGGEREGGGGDDGDGDGYWRTIRSVGVNFTS
jgi:hypothetical protein